MSELYAIPAGKSRKIPPDGVPLTYGRGSNWKQGQPREPGQRSPAEDRAKALRQSLHDLHLPVSRYDPFIDKHKRSRHLRNRPELMRLVAKAKQLRADGVNAFAVADNINRFLRPVRGTDQLSEKQVQDLLTVLDGVPLFVMDDPSLPEFGKDGVRSLETGRTGKAGRPRKKIKPKCLPGAMKQNRLKHQAMATRMILRCKMSFREVARILDQKVMTVHDWVKKTVRNLEERSYAEVEIDQ